MPYRWSHIRIVDPDNGIDSLCEEPISLWWLALAAADETMQGGPFVRSWLQLFETHLSGSVKMRWRGDLAESAEMRRAYSAMYGRYMARGLLAGRRGISEFVSLNRVHTQLNSGVVVSRTSRGDIPDWIGWDAAANAYVLAEAKGNLTGSVEQFRTAEPACIGVGKGQFDRVTIYDPEGERLETKGWVVASLWSTERRPREPISLLWDPADSGRTIPEGEAPRHVSGLRAARAAALAAQLGRPELATEPMALSGLVVEVSAKPEGPDPMPRIRTKEFAREGRIPLPRGSESPHVDAYIATLITPRGIQPIRDTREFQSALAARDGVDGETGPAMLFGVSVASLSSADRREPWLAGNGFAAADGLALFDLRQIAIKAV